MRFEPRQISGNRSLIMGENVHVMEKLIELNYKGKFNAIYFDGPFNSGLIFSVPNEKLGIERIDPWNELNTIHHYFNPNIYLQNYRKRIELARELLHNEGILVLQINQFESHHVKVLLDEVFGRKHFICEVIWKHSETPWPKPDDLSQFGYQHETLFFYSKTDKYLRKTNYVYPSVWDDLGGYDRLGQENTYFPSQKPEKLMERILDITTMEGDLVGDFYCGSGTFPLVAERKGRNWIACDNNQHSIGITKDRLSRANVTYDFHLLIDEYDNDLLKNHVYMKKTQLPFSVDELSGLSKAISEQQHVEVVEVHAYSYFPEVDLVAERQWFTFHLIVPSITPEGLDENEKTTIQRPIPVLEPDGYRLVMPNPFEWVLHNIVHVERNEYGCVRENKMGAKNKYIFDWDVIVSKTNDVLKRINHNWIERVEELNHFAILTDVFGYNYMLHKSN